MRAQMTRFLSKAFIGTTLLMSYEVKAKAETLTTQQTFLSSLTDHQRHDLAILLKDQKSRNQLAKSLISSPRRKPPQQRVLQYTTLTASPKTHDIAEAAKARPQSTPPLPKSEIIKPDVRLPPVDLIAESAKCPFMLRKDRTDIFTIINYCAYDEVPGANVSYTDNQISKLQMLALQGFASYTISRNSSSAIAASIYANGSLSEPFKTLTEKSYIRATLDMQGGLYTPDILGLTNYFDASPYYQTDFRGKAQAFGVDAVWEPYKIEARLGGREDRSSRTPIGFYWRLQPEADVIRVETKGLTNFLSDKTYVSIGGTLQGRAILFQNMPELGPLCGRIFVNGMEQLFQEVVTGRGFYNYSAEVGYYLSTGVAPYWRDCVPQVAGESPRPTAAATSSSISVVFSDGTDKNDLVKQKQYKVQLNFRF